MQRSRQERVINGVLRGYSAQWRKRHGNEAVVLTSALLDDGTPWWRIAGSFLVGAVRDRILRGPSVRVATALAALTFGIAALPLALFASLTTASASSTFSIVVSKPADAAQQLESAFAAHHFNITVVERPVSANLVGSILTVSAVGKSSTYVGDIRELRGPCNSGGGVCVNGLVLPLHYSGVLRVTVGSPSTMTDGTRSVLNRDA